jgi:hypothetical protein
MEHGVGGKLHSGVEWATCLCSSHGPSRKLTYVSTSVKGNIVNTNVYNNWYLSTEARKRWIALFSGRSGHVFF